MPTAYKTVHYRRLKREAFPDKTLAVALDDAMKSDVGNGTTYIQDWQSRRAPAPRGDGSERFINYYEPVDENGISFGTLCVFSPGQMQALLDISAGTSSPTAPVDMVGIAEETAPSGMEFLHGITYWLCIHDHFLMAQHISLKSKAIEEYFTWFLRDKTGQIASSDYVILDAAFDLASIGGDLGEINKIHVGGLVPETIPQVGDEQPQTRESFTVRDVEEHRSLFKGQPALGRARNILDAVFGDTDAQRIMNSVPEDAALEVSVNVGYSSTKRKIDKNFMSEMATSLRNFEDGEVRIEGKDTKIKGDSAFIQEKMPFALLHDGSSLLDLPDTRDKLIKVYTRLMEDGRLPM